MFSHFLTLYPLDSPETRAHLDALLQSITSSPDHNSSKYHMYVLRFAIVLNPNVTMNCTFRLSNLFNAIPRRSSPRLLVYKNLLELACANDEIHVLGLSLPEVEKWLSEWEISSEEKSDFLKLIVDVFQKTDEP